MKVDRHFSVELYFYTVNVLSSIFGFPPLYSKFIGRMKKRGEEL